MSSPDVLCNLCQQYFRQYDKNKNGFLDCHEAVEIAKDLGSTLAVPLGSTEEVLRPSLKRFSEEGRDALTLEEFSRWFPSVLGLEPLSPQHIQEMTSSAKEKWDPMASEQQLARQSLTPGYIAALASSPQTVRTLCKQFFKQYDANANGVLEFTEVRKLASDLSITLGISIDESRLKERLDTANSSGDAALSLDALCSWLPQLVENQTPPAQRILPAEQAPAVPKGHVEALRRSPRILVQLCRQYFRMYDRNQNSVLDDAELIVLAKDLGQCLGGDLRVPEGTSRLHCPLQRRQ
ncbi:unnamed protein product [Durusdinium trenchii]|uniref:EF-hand domain-containing protein n=1 Tax=Durusdinium trenchii TaxID=1381693 RepID=A0ABP0MTP0_9DINO